MSKFKFGGHLRPFWLTDLVGRIKVTVARNDGTKTARTDVFYVEGSTVGQVAYAVEQALFDPEEGRPIPVTKLKEADGPLEVCAEGDREVFAVHRRLTADDLPTLRRIIHRIERQERKRRQYQEAYGKGGFLEEVKPLYGDCGGEEASHQDPTCCHTERPEEGGCESWNDGPEG